MSVLQYVIEAETPPYARFAVVAGSVEDAASVAGHCLTGQRVDVTRLTERQNAPGRFTAGEQRFRVRYGQGPGLNCPSCGRDHTPQHGQPTPALCPTCRPRAQASAATRAVAATRPLAARATATRFTATHPRLPDQPCPRCGTNLSQVRIDDSERRGKRFCWSCKAWCP